MKRFLTGILALGLFSVVGLTGCTDEAKVERETTIATPSGTSTITEEKTIESSGENPPVDISPANP